MDYNYQALLSMDYNHKFFHKNFLLMLCSQEDTNQLDNVLGLFEILLDCINEFVNMRWISVQNKNLNELWGRS